MVQPITPWSTSREITVLEMRNPLTIFLITALAILTSSLLLWCDVPVLVCLAVLAVIIWMGVRSLQSSATKTSFSKVSNPQRGDDGKVREWHRIVKSLLGKARTSMGGERSKVLAALLQNLPEDRGRDLFRAVMDGDCGDDDLVDILDRIDYVPADPVDAVTLAALARNWSRLNLLDPRRGWLRHAMTRYGGRISERLQLALRSKYASIANVVERDCYAAVDFRLEELIGRNTDRSLAFLLERLWDIAPDGVAELVAGFTRPELRDSVFRYYLHRCADSPRRSNSFETAGDFDSRLEALVRGLSYEAATRHLACAARFILDTDGALASDENLNELARTWGELQNSIKALVLRYCQRHFSQNATRVARLHLLTGTRPPSGQWSTDWADALVTLAETDADVSEPAVREIVSLKDRETIDTIATWCLSRNSSLMRLFTSGELEASSPSLRAAMSLLKDGPTAAGREALAEVSEQLGRSTRNFHAAVRKRMAAAITALHTTDTEALPMERRIELAEEFSLTELIGDPNSDTARAIVKACVSRTDLRRRILRVIRDGNDSALVSQLLVLGLSDDVANHHDGEITRLFVDVDRICEDAGLRAVYRFLSGNIEAYRTVDPDCSVLARACEREWMSCHPRVIARAISDEFRTRHPDLACAILCRLDNASRLGTTSVEELELIVSYFLNQGNFSADVLKLLGSLRSREARDRLCDLAVRSNSLDLFRVCRQHGYAGEELIEQMTFASPEERWSFQLKAGDVERLKAEGPEIVDFLLRYLESGDNDNSNTNGATSTADRAGCEVLAVEVLNGLTNSDGKSRLCEAFLRSNDASLRKMCLDNGFMPRARELQAAFLFLTEQWEQYTELDFDYRLLRRAYQLGDPHLRRNITSKMRETGKSDLLSIVLGQHFPATPLGPTGQTELAPLLDLLTAEENWSALLNISLQAPASQALAALKTVTASGWQPDDMEERQLLLKCRELIDKGIEDDVVQLASEIPIALERSRLMISGRINSLSFSPGGGLLALGLNNRRAVIWDFQSAVVRQDFRDFDRAVGSVEFITPDSVLAAERGVSGRECAVYLCDATGRKRHLRTFQEPVRCVAKVNEESFVAACFNGQLHYLTLQEDGSSGNPAILRASSQLAFSPKQLVVDSSGARLLVMHTGIALLSLPDLRRIHEQCLARSPHCGEFAPEEGTFVIGLASGSIGVMKMSSRTEVRSRSLNLGELSQELNQLTEADNSRTILILDVKPARTIGRLSAHPAGVRYIDRDGAIIAADSRGLISLTRYSDAQALGLMQLQLKDNQAVTSMSIAGDQTLLALGFSDGCLSLMDLRPWQLRKRLGEPISGMHGIERSQLLCLADSMSVSGPARRTFRLLSELIAYRCRFDIDIDIASAPTLQPGEFDIDLD